MALDFFAGCLGGKHLYQIQVNQIMREDNAEITWNFFCVSLHCRLCWFSGIPSIGHHQSLSTNTRCQSAKVQRYHSVYQANHGKRIDTRSIPWHV